MDRTEKLKKLIEESKFELSDVLIETTVFTRTQTITFEDLVNTFSKCGLNTQKKALSDFIVNRYCFTERANLKNAKKLRKLFVAMYEYITN